jgi:hypothetical protein
MHKFEFDLTKFIIEQNIYIKKNYYFNTAPSGLVYFTFLILSIYFIKIYILIKYRVNNQFNKIKSY